MNTLQILLTIYFGLNFIIAIVSTIVFEGSGYYEDKGWITGIIVFIVILLIGIPSIIFGMIKWFIHEVLGL